MIQNYSYVKNNFKNSMQNKVWFYKSQNIIHI